jgi:hypothetical protein
VHINAGVEDGAVQALKCVLTFSMNCFTLKSGLSSSRTSSHGNILILVVVGCVHIVFSVLMFGTARMRRAIHLGEMYRSNQVAQSPRMYGTAGMSRWGGFEKNWSDRKLKRRNLGCSTSIATRGPGTD